MRTLYQFPHSHYCEKARWLLDHKGLDYVAKNLVPGAHRILAMRKIEQSQVPFLYDQGQWITDSTHIAKYLDQQYEQQPLFYTDGRLNSQIEHIEQQCALLGTHVRRWYFHYVLNDPNQAQMFEVVLGHHPWVQRFKKVITPVYKSALQHFYQVSEPSARESSHIILEILNDLNAQLLANGGIYLVGNRLSLADISLCSMTVLILQLPHTPWHHPNPSDNHPEVLALQEKIRSLTIGQYILNSYQNERHAKVDWRGVY